MARFEPLDPALRISPGDTLAGGGCLSPLVAESGIQAVLARSRSGWGDYRVPEGVFGVARGELIRLECNTGEVVGVVRR